jgi:hypothetical protein
MVQFAHNNYCYPPLFADPVVDSVLGLHVESIHAFTRLCYQPLLVGSNGVWKY